MEMSQDCRCRANAVAHILQDQGIMKEGDTITVKPKTTGLNIIQAIKSGRPFHRRREDGVDLWISNYDLETIYTMTFREMVADDWALEPEQKIELTEGKFINAFHRVSRAAFGKGHRMIDSDLCDALLKELGFKE
jgi:hypothetical protein